MDVLKSGLYNPDIHDTAAHVSRPWSAVGQAGSCTTKHYLEAVFKESVVEEPVSQEKCTANNGEVEELAKDKTTKVDVIPKRKNY